jgi:hypothetical protein
LPETGSVLGNTLVFYFRIVGKPYLTGLRKGCSSSSYCNETPTTEGPLVAIKLTRIPD